MACGIQELIKVKQGMIILSDDKRHTIVYDDFIMKIYQWNTEKNGLLKAERGLGFESVVIAIESGGLLDILEHPNLEKYPRQHVLVVAITNYTYLVPFVEEEDYYFLKTIIPSRKATGDYLNRGEKNEHD